ncbi:MAG: hypothetical protein HQL53_13045 [Magnetococcales bacterium]|nr:hypothetical protein [Magnetococcales bacterium]
MKGRRLFTALLAAPMAFFISQEATAKDACTLNDAEISCFQISLKDMHTTQYSVGMKSVNCKAIKLKDKSDKKLKSYLLSHPVPFVEHDGKYYFTDHHHMSSALRIATGNPEQKVFGTIIGKVSKEDVAKRKKQINAKSDDEAFWNIMLGNTWFYPFGVDGGGPQDPYDLPSVAKLSKGKRDNPYRSLAWMVRECGGYTKSPTPFTEFRWAYYLRGKLGMTNDRLRETIQNKPLDPETFKPEGKLKKDPLYQENCMGTVDAKESQKLSFCNTPIMTRAIGCAGIPDAQGLPGYIANPDAICR